MGEDDFYVQLAEQERARQRGIARSYLNEAPSATNWFNAAMAFWNSLPFVGITASDMNPYMQKGDPPNINGAPAKAFKTLKVANRFENYVANPAERAAAQDYIRELKQSNMYDQFLEQNPGYRINTRVQPGVSEDWAYPQEVMIRHGLRKPVQTANRSAVQVEQKRVAPRKTQRQRSQEYYQEKVEDRQQGVYKRQRKEFNAQKMLSDGDIRHINPGRPSMAKIRLASQNMANYSLSAQRQYDKVLLKAAKKGYTTEDMLSSPDVKDFLRNLVETEGHRW